MVESYFNTGLYLIALIVYYHRRKRFDLFFLIMLAYALTAIMGTIDYHLGVFSQTYDLSVFRLSFLFMIILINLLPYRHVDTCNKDIYISENKGITYLLYFFIAAGIVSAYFTLPKAIMLQQMDDWGSLRQDIYAGDSDITLYDSQFERLAKNFYSYLQPFGSIMAFYQLTKPRINKTLTVTLFSVWIINAYASATLVASRGMIMLLALKLLVLYIIFKNIIPSNRKKFMFTSAIVVGVFFFIYTMSVTEARFGDESNESLLRYFGHSMYAFDDGIMRTMTDHAWGRYQFGWLYRLMGASSYFSWTALGCTHGTAFMTYVGDLYVDFGTIGTFIIACLMALLVNKFTDKPFYKLSDLVVIGFTASWFTEGIFVFAGDQSMLWFMVFVVYFIVKFLENKIYNI